ncbi:MAG: YgaP-like transmembrane domain [Gammaproteobacteria bacterium]
MSAIRMLFISVAALILLGIWLTGFNVVHWVLYLPVAVLLFAGITGICPGYMMFQKLGFKGQTPGNKI